MRAGGRWSSAFPVAAAAFVAWPVIAACDIPMDIAIAESDIVAQHAQPPRAASVCPTASVSISKATQRERNMSVETVCGPGVAVKWSAPDVPRRTGSP